MQRGYRNWRGYVLSNVGDKSGDAGEGGGGDEVETDGEGVRGCGEEVGAKSEGLAGV